MEKRLATVTILISNRAQAAQVNTIVSTFSDIILCRQGLPFHDRDIAVISLIVEGTPDRINALTGRLGRVADVESKAVLTNIKSKEI